MNNYKKPILLIDCDGVLADLSDLFKSLNRVFRTNHKFENCNKYHLHQIWNVSPEEMDKAFDEIESFFSFEDSLPVKFSQEAIDLLSNLFEIKVLTARRPAHEDLTKRWLKKYFGEIEVIFARSNSNRHGNKAKESKIDVCLKTNAYGLIEDNPHELEELAKATPRTKAICIELPYNRHLRKQKNIFVGDWKKITEYLFFERAKDLAK